MHLPDQFDGFLEEETNTPEETAVERLTAKFGDRYFGKTQYISFDSMVQKLGGLEDKEQELGMPLDKFFVALFGTPNCLSVWHIDPHKGLQEVNLDGFENHKHTRYFTAFNFNVGSVTLGTNQYGKTWAFTKEELLSNIKPLTKKEYKLLKETGAL